MNNNLHLPYPLHSILIGIVLCQEMVFNINLQKTSNTRFEMSFGAKYEAYAQSIEMLFKDYISNPLKAI